MASKERTHEILNRLYQAVVSYDEDACVELSKRALEEGVDPYDGVTKGLAAGMERVGELYSKHEYFVPGLFLCSDALYAWLNILRPHIEAKGKGVTTKRQIVIGVIEGDV